MIKKLWIKFFLLLVAIAVVALTSALLLRELMLSDFREYLEGEREDRVYWIVVDLEKMYAKHEGWNREVLAEDMTWALMLGMEVRVKSKEGATVMDTRQAVAELPDFVSRRIPAVPPLPSDKPETLFHPYPLFLRGEEIGTLEVRFLPPRREPIFIERSNRMLLLSVLLLGIITLTLSYFFAKRMTEPIRKLTMASSAIGEGSWATRVPASGHDELRKLADTFNGMADRLAMQEDLRKKLLANVAHELRTPLAAVNGELEGMIDGLYPTDTESLKSLHAEIARLRKILEGIEELFDAQSSRMYLSIRSFPLRPFLRSIADRFDALFREKQIEFNLDCDASVFVQADPDRLSQIIVNLLSNALKACKPGNRVSMRAAQTQTDATIEISDTGVGISPEDLSLIFERFYKKQPGGLGLGLPIVKELVEAHSGHIAVRSDLGKGSVFTIVLPTGSLNNSS